MFNEESSKKIEFTEEVKKELINQYTTLYQAQLNIDNLCREFLIEKGETQGNFKLSEDMSFLLLSKNEERTYLVH